MNSTGERIPIAKIRTDGGTQTRAKMTEQAIEEYREAMVDGATFPPVRVYHDGSEYWLADGFHRLEAAKRAEFLDIDSDVRQGDRRAAVLESVGANAQHGVRRTSEDRRRAVTVLLKDDEWGQWPQGKIASQCGVSREYVNRILGQLRESGVVTCDRSQVTTKTKHGTSAKMRTAAIGKKAKTRDAGGNLEPTDQHRTNLTREEQADFARLESVIEAGLPAIRAAEAASDAAADIRSKDPASGQTESAFGMINLKYVDTVINARRAVRDAYDLMSGGLLDRTEDEVVELLASAVNNLETFVFANRILWVVDSEVVVSTGRESAATFVSAADQGVPR